MGTVPVTITREAWTPHESLIAEVSGQFDRTIESYRIHPNLISEHANHEESIRTGGYANRTLLELVQNAADALSGSEGSAGEDAGRVEIVLDAKNKVLYCANAGRPFSVSGLTAITMAHLSGKRGDEIGRFGLGFKSVLAVTDAPQVLSRSVSFGFNSPSAREALTNVGSGFKRFPVLRTATLLDPFQEFERDPILAELGRWAATVVKLPNVSDIERLRQEIQDFASEFLLFVSAVRQVRLRIVGDDGFETTHVSRDLGSGRLRIERPDGDGETWFVQDRMHAPSAQARKEVGEAVSRNEVKVTVAIPERQGVQRIGQFWSYFPLQDRTSASALFNAPWSVNDDRTTLLRNDYNREILWTLSEIFVDMLPRVRDNDPAAHLDYMPARGLEIRSFGDEILTTHIPQIAAERAIVPDAMGTLRRLAELRPLDFTVNFTPDVHQAWTASPNTGDDSPHWKCYTNQTRFTRLRDLFVAGVSSEPLDSKSRDYRRALEQINKRGMLSWFREWAEGDDPQSAAHAFRVAVRSRGKVDDIEDAKVIPTSDGLRTLNDKDVVFLNQETDIEVTDAIFVDPAFLREDGVEEDLRRAGFRNLDPEAILNARLAVLSESSGDPELTKVWDAALDVPVPVAVKAMRQHPTRVKVPTLDGGWSWPRQVFDVEEALGPTFARMMLDKERCLPDVAHRLGVVRQPVRDFPLGDEPMADDYYAGVLSSLASQRGPGERPIENVELFPGEGPGPFSMLFMLRDATAHTSVREAWTTGLLHEGDIAWTCEDLDTGRTYAVTSPVRWAVERAGIVRSNRGFRAPSETVSASLVKYDGLLPLFRGPRQVEEALALPDELDLVPSDIFREALEQEIYPPTLKDEVLSEFILVATRTAFAGSRPSNVPARVQRAIESRPPGSVFLATTDEQESFLQSRQRPYLRVDAEAVDELVARVGCRRFEDSFSFSMVVEGQQDSQRILDVYTGLRSEFGSQLVTARFARALQIGKRVTTEEGVEDQALDWHLEGVDLIVRSDADERQILLFINEAFGLRLDNLQLSKVLRAGLDHRLELLRQEARTVESDADRLDLYIGPDDLRDALPTGLWSALEAQQLVDDDTSVAELFLTVYGTDSLRILADRFREEGFSDVPDTWAGSPAAITWVRKMGFAPAFAGQRNRPRPNEFVVAGAVRLNKLHSYQKKISEGLRTVLTQPSAEGPAQKSMVELPTGAGKTRVATETVLRLFVDEVLSGTILWIAQSAELCEQAVQTFQTVWRYLGDERPLTIGRLWDTNTVHEPDTELSVVVATDAKIEAIMGRADYEWLSQPTAVFIDEAHRAGGSTRYTTILRWLGVDGRSWERPLVGLSATPFKGSAGETSGTKELVARFGSNRLTAFESDAYRQLVKFGVLASVRHEVLDSGIEVELNASERSSLQASRLIDRNLYERIGRNEQRMKVLVEHISKQDPDWPILVFTPSVLSAQVLAASLRYRGIKAASVSGQTGRQERSNVIKRFQDGDIKVLVNCDLLVQGFDAPGVRALYIARPTFSPGAYIQMAGRGLRGKENGGKEECLIVDVADNWGAMNDFLGYRDYEDLWREQSDLEDGPEDEQAKESLDLALDEEPDEDPGDVEK